MPRTAGQGHSADMRIFIILTGGIVIGIAHFKMELLIQKQSFRIILWASILLFLACLMLILTGAISDPIYGALISPLVSLGVFRLCRRIFLRRMGREPSDTFLNWQDSLAADRLFNVVFFVLASWLWIISPLAAKLLFRLAG